MLPRTVPAGQPVRWQNAMALAVRSPAELAGLLDLSLHDLPVARDALSFPLRVPRGYVARMRQGDAQDPLLRQVWPHADEDVPSPGYTTDPVGDMASRTAPGVLHKYVGRALLVTTGACAIHCRYCFRRHFPYGDEALAVQEALDYIAADPSITEVILSGGDPLALTDERLARLVEHISGIAHVRRLRIHTRLPIVLPERVDAALLAWLVRCPLQRVMVVHANHAQEIDTEVADALACLSQVGVRLLNQSVLLRGVNDSADALAALSERLFEVGVMPYYLHQLDQVQGAAHYAVTDEQATDLITALQNRLPGYLVPRLVREVAGAPSKLPLF